MYSEDLDIKIAGDKPSKDIKLNRRQAEELSVSKNDIKKAKLLGEKVEASSVQRIESTKADIAEPALVSKGIVRNAFLGIFLGFILSATPVILVAYFDDTIKSSEDITTVLGLPILGEVPSLVEDAGNILPKEASRK